MKKYKLFLNIILLWFAAHTIYVIADGTGDKGATADVAVVLGNKVNEDGTLSERLQKRLECGLEVYRQGRVKMLLVSGGLGREGHYEGDKMRDFLLQQGVPDSCVLVDNYGNNTLATVDNTLRLKDSLHFNSVLIVSQYFHITRTKMLFRKRGFHNISSASPNYVRGRDIFALVREFFAFYRWVL